MKKTNKSLSAEADRKGWTVHNVTNRTKGPLPSGMAGIWFLQLKGPFGKFLAVGGSFSQVEQKAFAFLASLK